MHMQIRGIVHGRNIELERETGLPDGADVTVQIEAPPPLAQQPADDPWERLLTLAEECAFDGPTDLAARHDHYAHGKPIE